MPQSSISLTLEFEKCNVKKKVNQLNQFKMASDTIKKQQTDLETFKSLCEEFKIYIGKLETEWKQNNKPPKFRDVYEVLRPDERKQIQDHINHWVSYVTPVAEEWWKDRGYGVIWPDDNSKPVGYYKLN
jgi:D-mannonate dehydratase